MLPRAVIATALACLVVGMASMESQSPAGVLHSLIVPVTTGEGVTAAARPSARTASGNEGVAGPDAIRTFSGYFLFLL